MNFRDIMEKFSVCYFGIVKVKMLLWEPKKGQLAFLEGLEDLRFSGNGQKSPNKFKNTQVPLK